MEFSSFVAVALIYCDIKGTTISSHAAQIIAFEGADGA